MAPKPGGGRRPLRGTSMILPHLLAWLAATGCQAPEGPAPADGNALEAYARARFSPREPGGVVLVARGERVLLHAAFGLADASKGRPMRADQVLPIGSITKSFTAGAILRLAAEGHVELADDVRAHFPPPPSGITASRSSSSSRTPRGSPAWSTWKASSSGRRRSERPPNCSIRRAGSRSCSSRGRTSPTPTPGTSSWGPCSKRRPASPGTTRSEAWCATGWGWIRSTRPRPWPTCRWATTSGRTPSLPLRRSTGAFRTPRSPVRIGRRPAALGPRVAR